MTVPKEIALAPSGRPCAVQGCNRPVTSPGQYCPKHKARWHKNGDPRFNLLKAQELRYARDLLDDYLNEPGREPVKRWLIEIGELFTREMRKFQARQRRGRPLARWQTRLSERWLRDLPLEMDSAERERLILAQCKELITVLLVAHLRPNRFPANNPLPLQFELIRAVHRSTRTAGEKAYPYLAFNARKQMGRYLVETWHKVGQKFHQRITQTALEDEYRQRMLEKLIRMDPEKTDVPELATAVDWPFAEQPYAS
jgi:hypothetical protein